MTDSDEFSGLHDVHGVMRDSAEILAALIGSIRGGEPITPELLVAADKSLTELAQWSGKLDALIGASGRTGGVAEH